MKLNTLTKKEAHVIRDKGTEAPFTGEYVNNTAQGVYVCRQCDAPLYNSKDNKRYFLGRPSDAFYIMRNVGMGISNTDFNSL
jgi:peptide methionine sulfoxide reductase MsrB